MTDIKSRYKWKEIIVHPLDSTITKITVNCHKDFINGLKLFDKDGKCILEAGKQNYENKEIVLLEGERLLGVRSEHYDDSDTNRAAHSNMVLVFGRLE